MSLGRLQPLDLPLSSGWIRLNSLPIPAVHSNEAFRFRKSPIAMVDNSDDQKDSAPIHSRWGAPCQRQLRWLAQEQSDDTTLPDAEAQDLASWKSDCHAAGDPDPAFEAPSGAYELVEKWLRLRALCATFREH